MSNHLNELVFMLDSFFKGLSDVGLILSYNVQIQKISLEDATVSTRINNTILQLIKRLKKMYSTLSCSKDNNDLGEGRNSNIDASILERILKQENASKLSTNRNCEQGKAGEIVVAYPPFPLAAARNKRFLSDEPIVHNAEINKTDKNCTDNRLVNANSHLERNVSAIEKQPSSTNADLPDKLLKLLDLGKTEERNDTSKSIEVYNVDSIVISEESLCNWNALYIANNTDKDSAENIKGNQLQVSTTNTDVTTKTTDNLIDLIERDDYRCDFLRQNVATTVLIVESLGDKEQDKERLSDEIVEIPKITRSECNFAVKLENEQFFCAKCKMKFESIEQIEEHRKALHQGYGSFECLLCNHRFPTSVKLDKHIKKHDNPFKCTECGKMYTTKLGLTRHLDIHEKKFACDICGKSYSRADYLPIHKAAHAKKVFFSCKSCPKKFLYKSQLKSHEKMHTGVKDFICEICDKGFSRNDKLKEHMLRHYNIRRYDCNACPKTFAEKRDLTTHIKAHHNRTNISK
ncbi:zinc finger protein 184 [Nilaparvata lugens]|uniref:zinc finger protein 184 n=1 Tax=Nilaparvata lugens TaxID=108931 RepID=UPI00193E8B43|nr:zinc finger protein 184 [Nilaparvata lugens]